MQVPILQGGCRIGADGVRERHQDRVLPCDRLSGSPKTSSATPGDAKRPREMPQPQICRHSV